MVNTDKVKLNTGAEIPDVGTGTWAGIEPEEWDRVQQWLVPALEFGYRHVDTALIYGTEPATSRAIKEAGLARDEVFITTKLPWHRHGREEESITQSLNNLDTDYVDLWLMHWPQAIVTLDDKLQTVNDERGVPKTFDHPFTKTWAAMEEIYRKSKRVRAIGVSNFSIKNLEILLKTAQVIPAVNQVELHPYLAQEDLLQYCREKGILLMAYTPTGYPDVPQDPTIKKLAEKYNVTPTQVILGWHIARGVLIIPGSKDPEHQKENITPAILDAEDVKLITSLDRNQRLFNAPDEHGTVWGWTMEQLGW
ncbi:Aldo/keto reductase [Trametopsis cervina]|nr:Aldo/keto reductase [Trametopsis cervina]